MTNNSQVAFVCCVESGSLETQTIRMVESLRRWGGRFASSPIYAVTPRFGPPLSKQTQQAFDKFQVEYIRFHQPSQYSWNKFLNKILALNAVEELAKTEYIGWLDSDLLIVKEPDQFVFDDETNFLACPSDKLNIASTGKEDPNDSYWQEICKCLGIDIENIPWIKSEPEGEIIRLYLNSGVFIYRRSTSFAKHYLKTFTRLCDSRIMSHEAGFFFNDQVALGLTVVKMGISWRTLPYSHNFAICSSIPKYWYDAQVKNAKIIHYHDSMWYWFWDTFLELMNQNHPDVGEWLTSIGMMQNQAPIQWRGTKKILDFIRKKQEVLYLQNCRKV
jgi:hypothetical protein